MSKDLDLNQLDQQELEQLRADVDQALKTLHARRLKEARSAAAALAKEHGFKLEDLVAPASSSAKKNLPAKYANPDDPNQTWSGRGRKPKWFNEAIESGKTESDLEI
jgi:DNA-binding protein H-NS|tara:strand:- start:42 stop:362 length:321 start_codon:yes stop_codon:yes gene_type:complete